MTRPLILLAAICCCAGCARSPAPESTPPAHQQKTPNRSAAQPSRPAGAQRPPAAPGKSERAREERQSTLQPHPPTVQEAAPVSAESSLQTQVEDWFANLSQGKIQYKVPGTMFWKEGSTVTVVVQGPQAPASSGLKEPTGTGGIKVSNRMKVVISCPDNPDEFTIAPEDGTSDIQFVPTNSSTTWNWSVTPKYTGRSQQLQISAWVLYPGQGDKILMQLPVYTATVNVNVPSIGEALKRLIEGDPDYWLKYGLPGGGGFVFVAGIIAWFVRRRAKRKKKRP